MTRIEMNDMIIGSYVGALYAQGYAKQADDAAKTYERQREEICELCGQPITECKC